MLKIEYSPQSLDDLQHLRAYVSTNWGDNVSKKILTKVTSDIRRLELYPMSGVNLSLLMVSH
jgi:plasmid stabilization system protein ParE